MITMEDRWEAFNKRYPDTDYRASNDARDWESDRDYLFGHIKRIDMRSDRFHFAIQPGALMLGLTEPIQEAYKASRQYLDEEKALERAFRIHDITISVGMNLKDLSEENIAEWLDWKGVVYWYANGFKLYLPGGMFTDHDWTEVNDAIEAVERLQPHCPTCGAVGWRYEINNLGQTVYWCDSWACPSRFTSDTDN